MVDISITDEIDREAAYFAVIPGTVRSDKRLTADMMILYSDITALCTKHGYCWAKNSYFVELHNVSENTISRWLQTLEKCGYIARKLIYRDGTKMVQQRRIYLRELIKVVVNEMGAPDEEGYPHPDELDALGNGGEICTAIETEDKDERDSRVRVDASLEGRPSQAMSAMEDPVNLVNMDLSAKIDDTLIWLQNKKRLRHLPPQTWLILFDDLALNGIDLDEFKLYYEWVESRDWVTGIISEKLLRNQVEAYLNRDHLVEKARLKNGGSNSNGGRPLSRKFAGDKLRERRKGREDRAAG